MSNFDLSVQFFLQLAVILATCRLLGAIGQYFGQPPVVCEMIAGVALGPSLFGQIAPELQAAMFPAQSKPILYATAQVALSLYMFVVGMEFRSDLFLGKIRSAATVSVAGMLAPFVLGGLLGWGIHRAGGYFAEGVATWEACVFLGASMCITAFPMLARIIVERGLSGTSLGTLALAAGAIDDAAAWCLLAIVLSSFESNWMVAVKALGGGVLYAVLMLTVGRSLLRRIPWGVDRHGSPTPESLVGILGMVMTASWYTDIIGIYAVFGAFLLGVAVPRGRFADGLAHAIEPLVTALLLPLFFTYSGLNTRLDLVTQLDQWVVAGLVLAAACLGKAGACWAAARWSGADHPTALAVGALMNARGLMELIILNIGLERGLITPQLFSVMVVMAIATTLMATPAFEWIRARSPELNSASVPA